MASISLFTSDKLKSIDQKIDNLKNDLTQVKDSLDATKKSLEDAFVTIEEDENKAEQVKTELSEKIKGAYTDIRMLYSKIDKIDILVQENDLKRRKANYRIITALCFVFAIGITALIIILKYIATGTF